MAVVVCSNLPGRREREGKGTEERKRLIERKENPSSFPAPSFAPAFLSYSHIHRSTSTQSLFPFAQFLSSGSFPQSGPCLSCRSKQATFGQERAKWAPGTCLPSAHVHFPSIAPACVYLRLSLPAWAGLLLPSGLPLFRINPSPTQTTLRGSSSYFKSLSNHHLAPSLSHLFYISAHHVPTTYTPPYQHSQFNSLQSVSSMDSVLLPGYKSATFSILFLQ